MKVNKELFDFQEQIQDTFNPERIKESEVKKLEVKEQQLQEKIDEQNAKSERLNYQKWDLIEQQIETQEQKEEVQAQDYQQEHMIKQMGCSQDHSKEIDIYSKTNEEKLDRIREMKDEGNVAYIAKDFQKGAYYYAQALLIFHYLIPETPKEIHDAKELKKVCHLNQSYCFWKLGRNQEALQELNFAMDVKKEDPHILVRRSHIYLQMTDYENAKQDCQKALELDSNNVDAQKLLRQVIAEEKKYQEKSKEMYKRSVVSKSVEGKNENKAEIIEEDHQAKEVTEQIAQNIKRIEKDVKQKVEKAVKQKVDKEKSKVSDKNEDVHKMKKDIRNMKKQIEELNMAVELFKNYGFQPQQFDKMMEQKKASKGFKMLERPDQLRLRSSITPIEKFQLVFIVIGINLMKASLLYVTVCLLATSGLSINLSGEFITGFESGIFLRANPQMMNDYGCPEPKNTSPEFQQFQQMIQPIKMMGTMLKDQNIDKTLQTVEVFVENLSALLAVFNHYDGGDFCSGLIFGQTGATMLTQIATVAFQIFMQPQNFGPNGFPNTPPPLPPNPFSQ